MFPTVSPGERISTRPSTPWPFRPGVDMAILDPGCEPVRGARDAYQTLCGLDENGLRYIGRYKRSQQRRDRETEARKKQILL